MTRPSMAYDPTGRRDRSPPEGRALPRGVVAVLLVLVSLVVSSLGLAPARTGSASASSALRTVGAVVEVLQQVATPVPAQTRVRPVPEGPGDQADRPSRPSSSSWARFRGPIRWDTSLDPASIGWPAGVVRAEAARVLAGSPIERRKSLELPERALRSSDYLAVNPARGPPHA
ncbi:hypothetical protein [Polyangium jinanense]|uniref:Uncharacterized protein n=1 Tax=Polyangium jinanense TaxID=2829994 RepID=A0A9X3XGX0_9BACT|nr:hypothetical protein [Polyangium jinanense]MDC3962357.1 hypothetical protein [Polyangium jinanense]MDC3989155.1 hypothetical protein [Polyangium jinanense]